MRDGAHLSATVYLPQNQRAPAPVIFALTPYTADHLHDRGMYFAARGLPFVAVDVRGRGNSDGEFRPYVHDAEDGYDVVEWLALQPYCGGKIGMHGGSYLGYVQWATAAKQPPHLATIVPTAAPFPGVDVPIRNNIFAPYKVQWLTVVAGRAFQQKIFSDRDFWMAFYRRHYESGAPLRVADAAAGVASPIFQEWLDHPEQDAYWDALNPATDDYAAHHLPTLTITGVYDGDQPGALEHYKRHMKCATPEARAHHYLVIGPWNHAGCAIPRAEFDGIKVGSDSVIDMFELHLDWYRWTLGEGARPALLQDAVTYYVMGAERWRHAPTLEDVTARTMPLYLASQGNPTDLYRSGSLGETPTSGGPDSYVYDPRDIQLAELESALGELDLTDQRMLHAAQGQSLVYHSRPFEQDTEVSGFFKLTAWISIDQPDTDFRICVYEIALDGTSLLLTTDSLRARYRTSLREASLVRTREPLRYNFERFTFVSRWIRPGHRLRVVFDSKNSIYEQRNCNSGGIVCEESMRDARPVTIRLFHDRDHPSALFVPVGREENPAAGSQVHSCEASR